MVHNSHKAFDLFVMRTCLLSDQQVEYKFITSRVNEYYSMTKYILSISIVVEIIVSRPSIK